MITHQSSRRIKQLVLGAIFACFVAGFFVVTFLLQVWVTALYMRLAQAWGWAE